MKKLLFVLILLVVVGIGWSLFEFGAFNSIFDRTIYYKGLNLTLIKQSRFSIDCPKSAYVDKASNTLIMYCEGDIVTYNINSDKVDYPNTQKFKIDETLAKININSRDGYRISSETTGGAGGFSPRTRHNFLTDSKGVKVFQFDSKNVDVLFAGVVNEKKYFVTSGYNDDTGVYEVKLATN